MRLKINKTNKNNVSNQGVTLLESLMAMFVMSILLINIMQFVTVVEMNMNNFYNQKQMANLTLMIHEDFIHTSDYQIDENKLVLETYKNQDIIYQVEDDQLIRKIDNQGHEVILINIESLSFIDQNNIIKVNVKFNNDQEEYEKIMGTIFF